MAYNNTPECDVLKILIPHVEEIRIYLIKLIS